MTEDQINKSIETKELKLKGWRKLNHYSIVIFFFLISTFILFLFAKDIFIEEKLEFENMWPPVLIFMIIPLVLGFLYLKIQRNKLKFITITTNLTREELDKVIKTFSDQEQWTIIYSKEKAIEAKTSPSIWSGSWGELIHILFDKQTVLLNSICDPDKRSSVTSYGRNKKNVEKLTKVIKIASR